jgi:hypothetical protein
MKNEKLKNCEKFEKISRLRPAIEDICKRLRDL